MTDKTRTWNVGEILEWTKDFFLGRGVESARLDAEVLLAHVLGVERIMLYTAWDRPLDPAERTRIRELVRRRANGEPIAYLTGEREFWSLEFKVTDKVLIPRPETEILIEECLALFRPEAEGERARTPSRVVDVGTGSGAIAVVLAKELPGRPRMFAVDVSAEALAVATENVRAHGLEDRVELHHGDLLTPLLDEGPFDLVAANLPYIRTEDMATLPRDVGEWEPHSALDGGPDGLVLVDRLLAQAAPRLASGGHVVLELGDGPQIDAAERLAERHGLMTHSRRRDYADKDRVLILARAER